MPPSKKYDRDQLTTLYLEVMDLNLPIITTIAQIMNVTYAQARYMVRVIRDEGFLGRPPHGPTRAVARRGTMRQRTWIACEECLVPWPCKDAFPFLRNQIQRRS